MDNSANERRIEKAEWAAERKAGKRRKQHTSTRDSCRSSSFPRRGNPDSSARDANGSTLVQPDETTSYGSQAYGTLPLLRRNGPPAVVLSGPDVGNEWELESFCASVWTLV